MHLRQEHPRSCAQRALCSCPSRCPAPQTWPRLGGCPKPQSTSGLKTRVPVCGASLGFHRCQMSQEVCAGPPGLLSCSGRGMAGWTRGPSRAGGRTRFGPPCLGASARLLCLPSVSFVSPGPLSISRLQNEVPGVPGDISQLHATPQVSFFLAFYSYISCVSN